MKSITSLCVLVLCILVKTTNAQDTIVKTDGSTIIAVVQEVGTTEIKYKKFATHQTSPVYDISKYEVKSIKYFNGTVDVFNQGPPPVPQVPAQPAPPATVYAPYGYGYPYQSYGPPSITGAYVYLSGLVSPLNIYQGSSINNYWQNLYSYEHGPGTLQLNNSNALLYSFIFGATLVFHKQNNWSYEFQFEMTPTSAIRDSANYSDGTHGNFTMWYMLLNDAIQYMRGIDSTNNFQIGGEVSLDIALVFGSENDVFYSASNPYSGINSSPDSTRTPDSYDDMHVGGHIAAVAKYFVGKSRTLGFEARAGYRFMKGYEPDFAFSGSGINTPISLSGPFVSLGIVLRLHASYCINCPED